MYQRLNYDVNALAVSWLRLARATNVGPKTFQNLLQVFGSSDKALGHLQEMARRGGSMKKIFVPSASDALNEIEACHAYGAKLLFSFEESYPKELAAIADPPIVLTYKGNIELLKSNKVAIVGSRNASLNGVAMAKDLSAQLGEAGFTIVSGLARGIDAAAHQAALKTGTIGIIGGGIDNIYPKENSQLFYSLYNSGLVLSEYHIGCQVMPQHFPQRNRIISGVSSGVIVVEAAKKSGTLITARFAAEQGRDVFAVPGSPFDLRCSGTNDLIRNGATLIESADDVVRALKPNYTHVALNDISNKFQSKNQYIIPSDIELSQYRAKVFDLIPYNAIKIDELIDYIGVERNIINFLLLELEVAGKITRVYSNSVMRINDAH